jgi:glutamate dehydrogenase
VLRNNYLQSQAISTLEQQAPHQLIEMQHLMRVLERAGELNRAVEFLPDDQEIAERHKQGLGLTRPEIAVLLAYSKITLNEQLIASDVPEDPYLSHELGRYFPRPVQKRLARAIPQHRLRREIIATATTNSLVNRVGPMFVLRVQEDTGATTAQVARAYAIAREAFRMRARWAEIEALDNRVPANVQYAMQHETGRLLRRGSYWLLRHRRKSLEIEAAVRQLAPAIDTLTHRIGTLLRGADLQRYRSLLAHYEKERVPAGLANFMAAIESLDSAFDIVEMADAHDVSVPDAALVYFEAGARVGLDWLRAEIDAMRVVGQWPAVARGGLRDAAQRTQRAIAGKILARPAGRGARGSLDARIDAWMRSAGEDLASWQRMLAELRAAGAADFATLSVGVDAVRKFAA